MKQPNKIVPNLASSESEAEERADKAFDVDPLKTIKPSLLSANEIVQYVEKTALIYPFDPDEKYLKHASYEGRIGSKAFWYNRDGERVSLSLGSGFLTVPNNSIVFVESDITFRLPRYIGLRFNLQIKHVHRGILLGTGPLIDPGFRGKLLIPLHNLTSEEYNIPVNDGLIWIEFTKTTYRDTVGHRYGNFPDRKNISDVERWLDKAEKCAKTEKRVPIRSSIPLLVSGANEASARAEKISDEAIDIAKKTRKTFYGVGIGGAIGGLIAILALIAAFGVTIYQQYSTQQEFITTVHPDFADTEKRIAGFRAEIQKVSDQISEVRDAESKISGAVGGLSGLDERVKRLENTLTQFDERRSQLQDNTDLHGKP